MTAAPHWQLLYHTHVLNSVISSQQVLYRIQHTTSTQYRHPQTHRGWFLSNVLLSVDIWSTVKHALSVDSKKEPATLSSLSDVSGLAYMMEINEVS